MQLLKISSSPLSYHIFSLFGVHSHIWAMMRGILDQTFWYYWNNATICAFYMWLWSQTILYDFDIRCKHILNSFGKTPSARQWTASLGAQFHRVILSSENIIFWTTPTVDSFSNEPICLCFSLLFFTWKTSQKNCHFHLMFSASDFQHPIKRPYFFWRYVIQHIEQIVKDVGRCNITDSISNSVKIQLLKTRFITPDFTRLYSSESKMECNRDVG